MGNEAFDESLLEILACPKCLGELEYRPQEAVFLCHACRLRYRIDDGIPVLLIDEAEAF